MYVHYKTISQHATKLELTNLPQFLPT